MGPIIEVELSVVSYRAVTTERGPAPWHPPYDFAVGCHLPFRTAIVIDVAGPTKGILRDGKVYAVPKDYVLKKDESPVQYYIAVRCRSNVTARPGDTVRLMLELEFYPKYQYEWVQPGATFPLRWGEQIVGRGTVLSRTNP